MAPKAMHSYGDEEVWSTLVVTRSPYVAESVFAPIRDVTSYVCVIQERSDDGPEPWNGFDAMRVLLKNSRSLELFAPAPTSCVILAVAPGAAWRKPPIV